MMRGGSMKKGIQGKWEEDKFDGVQISLPTTDEQRRKKFWRDGSIRDSQGKDVVGCLGCAASGGMGRGAAELQENEGLLNSRTHIR